jgi:hypothetical protein
MLQLLLPVFYFLFFLRHVAEHMFARLDGVVKEFPRETATYFCVQFAHSYVFVHTSGLHTHAIHAA